MQIRILVAALLVPLFVMAAQASDSQVDKSATVDAKQSIKPISEYNLPGVGKGEGAGSGEAAELNGYPGPAHVIQMAANLGLDDRQIGAVKAIHEEMLQAVRAIAGEVKERQHELDALFESGTVTVAALEKATSAVSEAQGRLHFVHFRAHLKTREVLTPSQISTFKQIQAQASMESAGSH
jgi:Spy/CpxP family protein refolding chaperone